MTARKDGGALYYPTIHLSIVHSVEPVLTGSHEYAEAHECINPPAPKK